MAQTIEEYINNEPLKNQSSFDKMHEDLCKSVIVNYNNYNIGRTQKWINMALKYLYVFIGNNEKYNDFFVLCHCPIDRHILLSLNKYPNKPSVWSNISTYDTYKQVQDEIEKEVKAKKYSCKLDYDFFNW